MSYIVPFDKPKCCIECPFCGDKQFTPVGDGLYERIGCCVIAPEYDEATGEEIDAYRNVDWLSKNTFDWCPLKEFKEVLKMFNYVLEIKTTYCDSEYSNHIGYSSATIDKMGGFKKAIDSKLGDIPCIEHFAGHKDFALVVTRECECVGDHVADIIAIFEYDTREEAEADIPVIQRLYSHYPERFVRDELRYNVDLVTFDTPPDKITAFVNQCIYDQF